MPDLKLRHVLREHRAAVNAVSISGDYIVSASGDRSMRLWDAEHGTLLHTFVDHHGRGCVDVNTLMLIVVVISPLPVSLLLTLNRHTSCPDHLTNIYVSWTSQLLQVGVPHLILTPRTALRVLSWAVCARHAEVQSPLALLPHS